MTEVGTNSYKRKVGILKEKQEGPFVDDWEQVYREFKNDLEEVDISPALSAAAFAVKDEKELVCSLNIPNSHC
jgi:nucleosome binding factor SPN SPT16 subunit